MVTYRTSVDIMGADPNHLQEELESLLPETVEAPDENAAQAIVDGIFARWAATKNPRATGLDAIAVGVVEDLDPRAAQVRRSWHLKLISHGWPHPLPHEVD